ncbi:cytochrome P450 [Streptomyces sp. NPDC127068]|uniref:cytochrome P450 n=1 Tax=Streptomyces sp. NPDC127068 TaxID=3347127 RepID=UPI003669D433
MSNTTTPLADLVDRFDHHDPRLTPDLAEEVHRVLRERSAVAHSTAYGGMWILTRFAEVSAAYQDHRTYRSGDGVLFPRAPGTPRFAPLEYDAPHHMLYRRLMTPAVALPRTKEIRDGVHGLVGARLRHLTRRGGGDWLRDLALPLPLDVLVLTVGFSTRARDRLHELTRLTWRHIHRADGTRDFWPQFATLLDEEIDRARRSDAAESYLAWLVRQDFDGRPATGTELHPLLVALAIAGHDTTLGGIGHMLWYLSQHPELQSALRRDPRIAATVADESLRLWPPVDHETRTTTRAVTIDGTRIPPGSRVLLLNGAANRDPRRYPDPDSFRLDRPLGHHLSFGNGVHFCVGSHLARLEMTEIAGQLADHPPFALTKAPRRHYENGRHAGFDQLTFRFRSPTPGVRGRRGR